MTEIGIVYKKLKNKLIVLTPGKGFVTIKNNNNDIEIGKQIIFDTKDILNNNIRGLIYRISSVAAILVIVFAYYFVNNSISYYVAIDIEKSIEFEISDNYIVKKVYVINDLNSKSIDKFKDKDVFTAINLFIKDNEENNIVNNQKDILISTSLTKKNSSEKDLNILYHKLKEFKINSNKGSFNYNTKVLKSTFDERQLALKNGMSMGKYVLYNKAKLYSTDLTIDDIKDKNVSEIINDFDKKNENIELDKTSIAYKKSTQNNLEINSNKISSNFISPTPYKDQNLNVLFNFESKDINFSTEYTSYGDSGQIDSKTPYIDLSISNQKVRTGLGSLKIDFLRKGTFYIFSEKDIPAKQGKSIYFNLWVTNKTQIDVLTVYIQDKNWLFTGKNYLISEIKQNEWNTLKMDVASNVILPIKRFGFAFTNNDKVSDVYIDDIECK